MLGESLLTKLSDIFSVKIKSYQFFLYSFLKNNNWTKNGRNDILLT